MGTPYYQWSGLVRNYVRDNALCRVAADFDAKSRKIRRVAQPEADTDAANKRYVEQCMQDIKNQLHRMNERLHAFETDMRTLQIAVDELKRNTAADSAHIPRP